MIKNLSERFDNKLIIINKDILKYDLNLLSDRELIIFGNLPYNISSQILINLINYSSSKFSYKKLVLMFQKEVAERICEPPGSKKYGILSVLSQLYYKTEYLFSVPPGVFNPPPKVDSAVIQMTRKEQLNLDCDEALLKKIVKRFQKEVDLKLN